MTAPIEDLVAYLAEARSILSRDPVSEGETPDLGSDVEPLRWFPNPEEIGRDRARRETRAK
jgi:hypothetical protein